ncbi:hypothetical protein KAI56_03530 [Candidatus Parcubacteria bacterium]|nr:hypothetical protein [Candidatus Parcubacteria bacterium]
MTKKNILFIISTLLLFFILLSAVLFNYQYKQVRSELAIKIRENENLIKKIDELQKEIEELKIFKKEEDINEITGWKTYKNEQQGFEIKLPPTGEWDYNIRIDKQAEIDFFGGFFTTQEEKSNLQFFIRKNLFSEVTPPFLPQYPFCNEEQETQLWNNKISQTIYSSYDPQTEIDEKRCDPLLDKFLLDKHLIDAQLCLNKDSEAYNAEIGRNGEYFFYCLKKDPLYYFALHCEGEIWADKEGKNKCAELFNQILSTFKFIK